MLNENYTFLQSVSQSHTNKLMRNKQTQIIYSRHLYLSGAIHVLSLILIFYMIYKYRQINKQQKKLETRRYEEAGTVTVTVKEQPIVLQEDKRIECMEERNVCMVDRATQLEGKPERDFGTIRLKSVQNLLQKSESKVSLAEENQLVSRLKQELQLQQERNIYLEEQFQNIQQQQTQAKEGLNKAKKSLIKIAESNQEVSDQNIQQTIINSNQSGNNSELNNLRNQLQYCQKLLSQNHQTLRQLKGQIASYQQAGERTLNHPEFLRLRQKNKYYKQTIFQLQKGLLQGHNHHFRFSDNFSFTSD